MKKFFSIAGPVCMVAYPAVEFICAAIHHDREYYGICTFGFLIAVLFLLTDHESSRLAKRRHEHADWCFNKAMEYKKALESELQKRHEEGEGWKG